MLGFGSTCGRQTHTLSLQLLVALCLLLFEVKAIILLLPLFLCFSLFMIVNENDHDVLRQAYTAIALTDPPATILIFPWAIFSGRAAFSIKALAGLAPPSGHTTLVALPTRATLHGQDTLIVAAALLRVEELIELATKDLLSH